MVKRTNAGGQTKGANEISVVNVHQHGGMVQTTYTQTYQLEVSILI